jgi:phosphatidylserine/phosphatidylglycerophosphate/cardiolipin synthase-like enzyme
VITGSANYSDSSTTDNDENTIVFTVDLNASAGMALHREALKRVADIYLTEYQRLFTHYVFRAFTQPSTPGLAASGSRFLTEDPSWITPYLTGWRAGQRKLFAAT